MRVLSKHWIIRNMLGIFVLAANLYWLIDTIEVYNKYQIQGILYVLIIPDWILFMNGISALIGVAIGLKILKGSITNVVKWVLIDLALFILMNAIEWIRHL